MSTNDKRSGCARMCLFDPCSRKQLSYIGGISHSEIIEQRLICCVFLGVHRQGTN